MANTVATMFAQRRESAQPKLSVSFFVLFLRGGGGFCPEILLVLDTNLELRQ